MPKERIEKLERVVGELLAEFDRLEAENRILSERVAVLEAEAEQAEAENQSLRQKLAVLRRLEVSNQKMEKQQGMIRIKVQSLLDNLEKMDIP
jgi:predicted RNase H-like nuclease (RuvC/YqgF family)